MDRRFLSLAAVFCSIAFILVAILPWRGFDPTPHWHRVGWIPFVSRPVSVVDFVGNVALFAPLGAAMAVYAQRAVLAKTAATAFACSFFGEWAQVYSRYRYPSAGDLVCNVVGAVLAAYGVERMSRRG